MPSSSFGVEGTGHHSSQKSKKKTEQKVVLGVKRSKKAPKTDRRAGRNIQRWFKDQRTGRLHAWQKNLEGKMGENPLWGKGGMGAKRHVHTPSSTATKTPRRSLWSSGEEKS